MLLSTTYAVGLTVKDMIYYDLHYNAVLTIEKLIIVYFFQCCDETDIVVLHFSVVYSLTIHCCVGCCGVRTLMCSFHVQMYYL